MRQSKPGPEVPLTEATYYILLSLMVAEKHGYAILKDVAELSRGTVRLSTSTLYSALERMQGQGLIERLDADTIPPGTAIVPAPGLPRKAYRITGAGSAALESEMERLRHMLNAGECQMTHPAARWREESA